MVEEQREEGNTQEEHAVNFENITPDGAVAIRVLRRGEGECPPKHARCLVHYVGKLTETGEVFMDSKAESHSQEPVTIVAGRDSVAREVGLNLAVAAMHKGEVAEVRVAPRYGYGERGSFSFPTVPPNAHLTYEAELLGFEAAVEDREPRQMLFEERLEAAERRRQDGNTLFKAEQFEEALAKYQLALSYLDEDLLMQLQGFHLEKAEAVRQPILLNMAACSLRQGDFHAAIAQCSEVLREQPESAKALFRRGRARRQLGQTDAAQADLEAAYRLQPEDKVIAKELQAVKAERRREREAESKLFKGYFERAKGSLYEDSADELSSDGQRQQRCGGTRSAQLRQQPGSWLGAVLSWLHGWLVAPLAVLFPAYSPPKSVPAMEAARKDA